jgi:hypothetical protein
MTGKSEFKKSHYRNSNKRHNGSFDRNKLPEPTSYFESIGLNLKGPKSAPWRTTSCNFHGGSDSLRVKVQCGAWVCMNCGVKGGDIIAYHMQANDLEFIQAAKDLGCWDGNSNSNSHYKVASFSPRLALEVLSLETSIVYVLACDMVKNNVLKETDKQRLMTCAARINLISKEFQA